MSDNTNKIIPLYSDNYKFIALPVWIDLYSNPVVKKQLCMIGLKEVSSGATVIHPLSEFISSKWLASSYNTQRKHAINLSTFMNYLLDHRSTLGLSHYTDLKPEHANLFLNWLSSSNRNRKTVKLYERTLTHFYFWLSKENVISMKQDQFVKVQGQYGTYYESPFGSISYPQPRPVNSEHMLPINHIPLLLEIAILFAQPIALGIYMQIFGGIRIGEGVNLKRSTTSRNFKNGSFLVDIKNNISRTDLKNHSGSGYSKKNRQQVVLQIHNWGKHLFNAHTSMYQDKDGTGALFVNRDGKAMSGESYRQYFTKVKKTFIQFLKQHGSPQDKLLAHHLSKSSWSTHIGRGTFTNLLADEVDNAFDLAFMRGDYSLLSSLAYMTNTERMRKKIEEKFRDLHEKYLPKLLNHT